MPPGLVCDLKRVKQSVILVLRRLCFTTGVIVAKKLLDHLVYVWPVVRLLEIEQRLG
jgi:hypothetical protein